MDVICINDLFSVDTLEFYQKYGVTHPKRDKIYNIREVYKAYVGNTSGEWGLLLQEIHNPKVPIAHPVLGVIEMEPNWALKRFATLAGEPLTAEYIKEVELILHEENQIVV